MKQRLVEIRAGQLKPEQGVADLQQLNAGDRSTRISRHFNAPPAAVYRALTDAQAIAAWRVPEGMRSEVHAFDAREGGAFRISLTYDSPGAAGKTSAHTDTYHGHFVQLVPDQQVVERMAFETSDPAMQGDMTVSYTLAEAPGGGTQLQAVHSNLPPGVALADNATGWRMALGKLAALVEGDSAAEVDRAAICTLIATYFQGHALNAAEPMRTAFLPSAHIEGNRSGVFTSWDLPQYCELFKGQPAADEASRRRSIDLVDISGDAAMAKATLVHGDTTFTDYFVLLKVAGSWKIANKVYAARPSH